MSTQDRTRIQEPETLKSTVQAPETHEIHEILSSPRREEIIKAVHTHEQIEFQDLVTMVAARLEGTPECDLTDKEFNRYRASIHQTHLDALKDMDVITYERKTGTIELGANAGHVIKQMPTLKPSFTEAVAERVTNVLS